MDTFKVDACDKMHGNRIKRAGHSLRKLDKREEVRIFPGHSAENWKTEMGGHLRKLAPYNTTNVHLISTHESVIIKF